MMSNQTLEPIPTFDSTQMQPPIAETSLDEIANPTRPCSQHRAASTVSNASPRPVPPYSRVLQTTQRYPRQAKSTKLLT